MKKNILEIIKKQKLIAIIRGIDLEKVNETVNFLCSNNLELIEFTFMHNLKSDLKLNYQILKAAKNANCNAIIGAGTVLSKKEVRMAKKAGACFIVMPDTNPEVIRYAKKKNLTVIPGALTPSEIITAYDAGADAVKIFPSDNLGSSYIKALQGPLDYIPKIAVGGIDEKNAASFLKAGCIALGVGGRLLNVKEEINKGIFSKVKKRIIKLLKAINGELT